MKKLLLAAIGATGLLASCDTGPSTDTTPPTITSASNLRTNHQLSVQARDANTGVVYPAGTYVICDNRNTTLEMSVAWTGQLYNLNVFATGGYYGANQYDLLGTYTAGGSSSGSGTITYTFGANAAPLSLKSQAITVNPVVAIDVKGFTRIAVNGTSALGKTNGSYAVATTLNTVPNTTDLPVVDCQ